MEMRFATDLLDSLGQGDAAYLEFMDFVDARCPSEPCLNRTERARLRSAMRWLILHAANPSPFVMPLMMPSRLPSGSDLMV
jgi:hypothetical protein